LTSVDIVKPSKVRGPNRFLNYGRQLIDDADVEAVLSVLNGDFLTQGPVIERFEAAVCELTSARHAVAVSSGTAALHVACLAAQIGPGSLGIVPAVTFVASANAFIYAGGDVALADIDATDLNLSTPALARAIESFPEAKAVMTVQFAGLAARSTEIRALSGSRVLIEDASHAFGGRYETGEPVGSCRYADMTVFSFHPVKTITTGEGGLITTNDDELARRLRLYRNHGIERDVMRFVGPSVPDAAGGSTNWYYEQQVLGFNYRLSDIHAALGLSQVRKVARYVERRREIAAAYDKGFDGFSDIVRPQSNKDARSRSALHLYVVEIDFAKLGTTRVGMMRALAERSVGSQLHYVPLQHQPFHTGRRRAVGEELENTEVYFARALSLPIHPGLTDAEVDHVIRSVRECVAGADRPSRVAQD
jgi:perosamine synthetase